MLKKIIKCSANWCAPCKALEPIYDEAEKKYSSLDFVRINVDNARGEEEKEFLTKNNVRSIPTLFFLDEEGNILHTEVGYISSNKFDELVDKLTDENEDK